MAVTQKIIKGRIIGHNNTTSRPTKALVYGIENKTQSMVVLITAILLNRDISLELLSTTSITQKTLNRSNNSKIADWPKSIVNKTMELQNSTRSRSPQMSKTFT